MSTTPVVESKGRGSIAFGSCLTILGLMVGVIVYSNRPPASGMDALAMLFQGRQRFIDHGPYEALLGGAALCVVAGVSLVIRTAIRNAELSATATSST